MRVLVVAETLWPCGGGGELATYLYVKEFLNQGVDVRILVRRLCGFYRLGSASTYVVKLLGWGKFSIPTSGGVKVVEKLFRWADIIYFTGMFNFIPLAVRLKKPIVVHVHSYAPICPVGHMYNFVRGTICSPYVRACFQCILLYEQARRLPHEAFFSALLNRVFNGVFVRNVLVADRLVFVSNAQRKLFLEHLSFFHPKIQIEYDVIYNPPPKLNAYPIEGDNVCYFGGLDPIKGFKYLFTAWYRLYRRFPSSRLLAAMADRLARQAERVNIVGLPRLYGSNLETVCRLCRVVVVPSICPEPSPYVVIEALLRGRLLIASRVGGIPEIAGGAPGARFVEPGDVDGLVDALNWALSMDRNEATELGSKNREYALKKFDSERSAKELIQVFEHTL